MARQPNKTLIGAFVVGSVALAVAALFIFSSGKLFKETRTFVLYFDGSLKGLDVGAPVNFKGIKIGSVTDIKVEFTSEDFTDIQIPVLVEVEPDMIQESSALVKKQDYQQWRERREAMQKAGQVIKSMIDRGLRAQLISQSMVTGKLMIQLDFYPDKPARFVAVDSEYPEIPTIPSRLDEIAKDPSPRLPHCSHEWVLGFMRERPKAQPWRRQGQRKTWDPRAVEPRWRHP